MQIFTRTFIKIIIMQFQQDVPVKWLANFIDAKISGDHDAHATGINELHKVEPGDIAFVDHPKYYDSCLNSAATCIIINKDVPVPEGKTLLITDDPFEAYSKIINHFRPFEGSTKQISDKATIGAGTFIYPGAFVGNHVVIGKDCIIHPNVTIMDHCKIGDRVIIQAGTVIGSDAFYYNGKPGRDVRYKKMPSCGRVIIEDDVEIGSGCTIDRGVSHDTRIGLGTKMDNLIHIGHDTTIGKNCLIAANVIVAGVVTIKDNVTIWGGVIINKTLTIGENVVLLGRTGVGGDLAANKTYWGAPAQEAGIVKRELIWIKRIPEMWDTLKKLSKAEKENRP